MASGWATAHRKPVCAVARKGATAFRGTKWPRQVAPFRVLALPAYARGAGGEKPLIGGAGILPAFIPGREGGVAARRE